MGVASPEGIETQASDAVPPAKKVWRPPVLVNLGSAREMTLTLSPSARADGMPSMSTSRGGILGRNDEML